MSAACCGLHDYLLAAFIPASTMLTCTARKPNRHCPFTNPGPLEAYYAAADTFHRDLQREFISDDTANATLAMNHTLLTRDSSASTRRIGHDLGRPTHTLVVRNPFLQADARCLCESVLPSTSMSTLPLCHRYYTTPRWKSSCKTSGLQLLAATRVHNVEQLEAVEAEAQTQARHRALPSPISTGTFYLHFMAQWTVLGFNVLLFHKINFFALCKPLSGKPEHPWFFSVFC
ncbi:hypothetical protein B0H14DRAFT_2594935 [Mycena olivaceomarginata]|nr:hypothetical protein B0H14DRAFT_2594935 [Mycena olivaceomarginata]